MIRTVTFSESDYIATFLIAGKEVHEPAGFKALSLVKDPSSEVLQANSPKVPKDCSIATERTPTRRLSAPHG